MKTTIYCEIEECILGANIVPKLLKGLPTENHIKLWNLISKENAWFAKSVEPKENENDSIEWYRQLGERLLRVCSNRKFKTTASVFKRFPNDSIRTIRVTIDWDSPVVSPLDKEIYGEWTLRKIEKGKRNKIISNHRGYLDCWGEDLVGQLPDEAQHFECETDVRSVVYFDKDNEESAFYEFRFQNKRKRL